MKYNESNLDNNLHSKSLDLLRFPLAVIILIIHVFTCTVHSGNQTIDTNSIPLLHKCSVVITGFLGGQSVPIYYFISGFVFFCTIKSFSKEIYLQKLKNRCKSLFIPYIIWNIVLILMTCIAFLPIFPSLFPHLENKELNLTFQSIWNALWDYNDNLIISPSLAITDKSLGDGIFPINVPLWFLRDLMIVIISTPILYWIIKYAKFYIVIFLGLIWFSSSYFTMGHLNHLTIAFFFFAWGSYIGINHKDMLNEFKRFFIPSLVLYPLLSIIYILSAYYYPDMTNIIKRLNIVVGLFFAYNISNWLLTHRICKISPFLSSSSFFIYVSHYIIIGILFKVLFSLFKPQSQSGFLLIYLLDILISIFLLLSIFYLLRKYMPPFLKILVGRK